MLSEDILKNIEKVRSRIKECIPDDSKKFPDILAVSKCQPLDKIIACHKICPSISYGENYVQELHEKYSQLQSSDELEEYRNSIKFVFIGHLQSNKVNSLIQIPNVVRIETVDSIKLSDKLNHAVDNYRPKGTTLEVLIEINTSTEDQKSGVRTEQEACDLACHIISSCPLLKFSGLMTVAAEGRASECFQRLNLFKNIILSNINQLIRNHPELSKRIDHLKKKDSEEENFDQLENKMDLFLSMGMSDDLESALQNGTSQLRIGRSIFGERIYPNK